jgi:hypothetical protein
MGVVMIYFVIRVWLTHPVNRVFYLGSFVTEKGLELILRNCPTIFGMGLFFLSAASAKMAYTLRWANQQGGDFADFFGAIEAAFAVWAASCVTIATVRLCRRR